jgi:cobalt-zinc-cadmium efflux system protein
MSMSAGSHKQRTVTGKNLFITILLNVGITVAQVIGGLLSGSMALLSDAAHNFSDVLSLIVSLVAEKLSGRERTLRQTYGYMRAGIFAAFFNAATLLIIATILVWESIYRIIHPQPIAGLIVIYLAALGILLNGLSVLLIKKDAERSMNMRSAYLHLFTDMMTSIAVLAGGFAIKFLGWFWIDGMLSIGIAIYLVYSSWGIFYEAIRIFMQFTPSHIDIEEIARKVTLLKGVKNMHHVHVWQLDDREMMLEAHLDLDEDYSISRFEDILDKVDKILEQYDIHHFNIQPELHRGDQKELINTGKAK